MTTPESAKDIFWRGNEIKREKLQDGNTAVYYDDGIMIQVYIVYPDGKEEWDPHLSLDASHEAHKPTNPPSLDPRALIGLLAE